MFLDGRSYSDWLEWQEEHLKSNRYTHIIYTDIADFYQRIYLHRLENTLDSYSSKKQVNKYIVNAIKSIRSRQSYGIPVGGSACRLLAEAVLADADASLRDENIIFTRFVDDYRIYLKRGQSPYETLSLLAGLLYTNEGLTLNGQKTAVHKGGLFLLKNGNEFKPVGAQAEDLALEALSASIYFDEVPDEKALEKLRSMNLKQMLEKSIQEKEWDFGKIKAIIRALRISSSPGGMNFLITNFEDMLPFTKEMLFYFEDLKKNKHLDESALKSKVLAVVNSQAAGAVPVTKAWLLEFFVRGIVSASSSEIRTISTGHPLHERQVALIRGISGDVNYFRRLKTDFDNKGQFVKSALILAASCLPRDEFETWVSAIRPRMNRPLDNLYCAWARKKSGKLKDILANSRTTSAEHEL